MEHSHLVPLQPPLPLPLPLQLSPLRVSNNDRRRLDSFESLSLSAPSPSPPFFHPPSQSQSLPPSPSLMSHRPRSPTAAVLSTPKFPQSPTPINFRPSSTVGILGTSFPSSLPSSSGQSSPNVIDLTTSPSPSPVPPAPPALPSLPRPPQFSSTLPTTLEGASPKTPVCIGRLDVTALILYPSAYLEISPSEPSGSDPVWGPVRLQYERTHHHSGSEDTIQIRTPNKRSLQGEIYPGENFAVVERRASSILAPMLGKGLIRLDSRIRRGNRHVRASHCSHFLM
jgi:SWI/SNF-related matrix-associated actin-dependent regulator of chromatin subfamily A3